ncbi:hypothetical protein FHS10_001659 [Mucilaginibacter dorajii]|nr:hypothetical protein [Mucilaginibacter dorajii]
MKTLILYLYMIVMLVLMYFLAFPLVNFALRPLVTYTFLAFGPPVSFNKDVCKFKTLAIYELPVWRWSFNYNVHI